MKTVLVIEDDAAIAHGLEEALTGEHYKVLTALTGEKGLSLAKGNAVDMITLDLKLPDRSGADICRELRAAGIVAPILVLSSKKEEMDKVLLLEIGADDYVTKPFSVRELMARVKALLRRHTELKKDVEEYSFGTVYVDFRKQEATKGKKALSLSAKELEILKYLIIHEGEVVTRERLLNDVWGYETFPTTRTVDNYILALRKKLEDAPSKPKHVLTIHTAGYKFMK
jgi:DNA-binding response OmpR family regulator